MLNFLKHKFTKKDRFLAKWGLSHFLLALVVGVFLAYWLLSWSHHADETRVQDLKQGAESSVDKPDLIPPGTGKIGGPFAFTSQDNKPVSDKDFTGQYLLIYFGYTSCPDMCPTGLQSMSRALDMLKADANKVQPLFITVDPARDTPAKLKNYDSAFNPRIIGLTGSDDQIASVAKEYQVYYQKGEGDQDYEVAHSSLIYLMDPNGSLITTFDEEVDPALIVSALQKAWSGQSQPAHP